MFRDENPLTQFLQDAGRFELVSAVLEAVLLLVVAFALAGR